ncbi:ATPase [Pseudarthrobacter sp. O4]|uniref:ATPase n=1 Tax=Pseudarthrobacter sp. O4 TaxID=3418417 RepID=UPI003CF12A52
MQSQALDGAVSGGTGYSAWIVDLLLELEHTWFRVELHAQLSQRDVKHCVVEGDNLDLAYPAPWEHHLAERNLSAVWNNYRGLGYRRMIYTNTVCVRFTDQLAAAMGDGPRITAVLLTSTDETAHARLRGRIQGVDLLEHINRSSTRARELEALTPSWVHRITTDGRSVEDVASELHALIGWPDGP